MSKEPDSYARSQQSRGELLFVCLAFLTSWTIFVPVDCWILPLLRSRGDDSTGIVVATIAHMVGMMGPALAAAIVTRRYHGEKPAPWQWGRFRSYVLAASSMALLWIAPAIVGLLIGHTYRLLPSVDDALWVVLGSMVFFGWGSGIGEEAGWCGYLLERLTGRMGRTRAVVLAGVIRGVWHLPVIIGPAVYGAMHGSIPWTTFAVTCLFSLLQLGISNVLMGAFFSFFWYSTRSVPFVGWMHMCFDTARDIPVIFVLGYAQGLWFKYGWALVFSAVAYSLFSRIARAEGFRSIFLWARNTRRSD